MTTTKLPKADERTQHTPGPWETIGATKVWKVGETGGAVAIMAEPECATSSDIKPVGISSARFDEACANARLIAAAPELLDALKSIAEFGEEEGSPFALSAAKTARAAIAKATGQ